MNRDEYVARLKAQLDEWNAEVARWEAKMQSAQADLQAEYRRRLDTLHQNQQAAAAQLQKLQQASSDAWMDLVRGADEAWKRMNDAFLNARSHFDKK